jgi:hypothetical protein
MDYLKKEEAKFETAEIKFLEWVADYTRKDQTRILNLAFLVYILNLRAVLTFIHTFLYFRKTLHVFA